MRGFFFGLLLFCFYAPLYSQGHEITFKVKNYDNDTLIVGNFFANRQVVVDTLLKSDKNKFTLAGKDRLKPGMYLVLLWPYNNFAQFLVAEDEQKFEVILDTETFNDVKFKNSKQNDLFYSYLTYLGKKKEEVNTINQKREEAKAKGLVDENAEKKFKELNEEVSQYQKELVSKHKNTLFSKLIQSNFSDDIPEFEGEEDEIQMQKYLWYKKHYFDYIDLGDSVHLRMPYLHQKLTYYMENLTPLHPDSIITSIDYLLEKMRPSSETFRYYLSHFYNDIIKKRMVGMDAVIVHMVDKYYAAGKAPWLDQENIDKITDNANRLRGTLIGKTAPNIKLYQEDGTPWELYKDSSEYLVLIFWAPECGHCTKSMPKYLAFNEKYKEKGVKMVTVCTKTGPKYKNCWEGVKEKNMEGLLNLGDQYLKSNYKTKFDVRQTPKLYILSRDKEILLKDVPADALESLMDEVIKMQELKENTATQ